MFSLILALCTRILVNPFSNLFQKQLTVKGVSSLYINFCIYIILTLSSVLILPWIELRITTLSFFLYGTLVGFFGAVGNAMLIKAFEKGDLSVLGPINSYKSIVGMIVGVIILREIPNLWGVLGIILIVIGSYIVLYNKSEKLSFQVFKNRDIQFRVGAMFLGAIEAVFIKKMILSSTVYLSFVAWCFFGACFSFLLLRVFHVRISKEKEKLDSDLTMKILFLVISVGLMQFTTNYVFDQMNVGYALALFQLSSLISIILGYKFFKEKEIKKKIIGAIVMIAGSSLILLMK